MASMKRFQGALGLLLLGSGCMATGDDPTGVLSQATSIAASTSLTAAMPSPTGSFQTFTASGTIDTTNAFFQSLGSNGRACVHCHEPQDAWTITPAHVLARFNATTPKGTDPIFRTNDGSNSPLADVSTEAARQTAYSMLLTKGLIRVGIGIPDGADFELLAVDDPYHYASAVELSLFRRPLPSTNLTFLATVMWDGRETFAGQTIGFDLADQANGATLGHAQAVLPLDGTSDTSIVTFETSLFTAATVDDAAGNLSAKKGNGGPAVLATTPFHIGINDVLGNDPAPGHPPFTPNVFMIYDGWSDAADKVQGTDAGRGAVYRGEKLFNTRPITITGVNGLNDALGQPSIAGTCTTCHDTPSSGNHSVGLPIDIGLASASLRTPDMPLYTLRNKRTLATVQTTDPGRALITGRYADIGKFKGPILRALSARAPYFHNGFAATLDDVVTFYDSRFALGLTAQEHADLVAFLRTL